MLTDTPAILASTKASNTGTPCTAMSAAVVPAIIARFSGVSSKGNQPN